MTTDCSLFEIESIVYSQQEEYKTGFLDYIGEHIEPLNEKKSEMIKEYLDKINCLRCFDVKMILQKRKYLPFSSLDFQGTYDVISCSDCGDGSLLYPTHELCEKSGKRRIRYDSFAPFDDLANSIYHIALENETTIPDWEFIEDESIHQKISQTDVDGDVKQIVDTIQSMVRAYFADPTSITNLLENIQIKIKHFCSNSKTKKEICQWIEGERTLFIFELEKETTKTKGGFLNINFSNNTDTLNINIMCAKPKNKAAEKICMNMMNRRASNIMSGFTKRTDVIQRRSSSGKLATRRSIVLDSN
jgi:hypothetical protein